MPPKGPLGSTVEFVGRFAAYLFVVIVVITAYEVVMRYAFKAPTLWVHEVTVALAAAAFVVGGPYVHRARRHIAITYFFERMSPGARRLAHVFISIVTLIFLAFLSYAAVDQAHVSLRDMETSGTAMNLPTPVFLKTLFAIACVVLTLQTLVHLFQDVAGLKEPHA